MMCIITIGISASGKSTWAQNLCDTCGFIRIERDEIRKEYYFDRFKQKFTWSSWRWEWEGYVDDIRKDRIELAALNKWNIILSDTNTDNKLNTHLKKTLIDLGYVVKFKIFNPPLESAILLDSLRPQPVSEAIIRKQHAKLQNTTINVVDILTSL